ncbi:MAG: response regulator transcription factor [Armatimonadota bacterium]
MAHTVLVVDDHQPTVELITDALTPHGFNVVSAGNGVECLVAVDEQQPDLVILDINMPVLNGLDTLRLLRLRVDDTDLPVIMLSGREQFADVRDGFRRGADIYLTKPVKVGAVVAAVKWLLQSGASSPTSTAWQSEAARVLSGVIGSDS